MRCCLIPIFAFCLLVTETAQSGSGNPQIERAEQAVAEKSSSQPVQPGPKFVEAEAEDVRRYADRCLDRIAANIVDPGNASDEKGAITVTIAVRSDGSIESLEIDSSSGHRLVDRTLMTAIDNAAPFAPFPASVKRRMDVLHITRTFTYGDRQQATPQETLAVADEALIAAAEALFIGEQWAQAAELLDSASHGGNPRAQVLRGQALVKLGDLRGAEIWLAKAAGTGDGEAQFQLAGLYSQMLPDDQTRSLEWIRKSAAQDYTKARLVLDLAESAPVPPQAIGGIIDTLKLTAYVAELSRRHLTANPRALACYQLDAGSFEAVYGKSVGACSKRMAADFPEGVPQAATIAFSRQFGACIKEQNRKAKDIALEDLQRCVKKL